MQGCTYSTGTLYRCLLLYFCTVRPWSSLDLILLIDKIKTIGFKSVLFFCFSSFAIYFAYMQPNMHVLKKHRLANLFFWTITLLQSLWWGDISLYSILSALERHALWLISEEMQWQSQHRLAFRINSRPRL